MSLQQLADAEQVAAQTMTKIVVALERDRLVRREPDPRDGRAVRLSAPTTGKNLMERRSIGLNPRGNHEGIARGISQAVLC